MNHKVARWVGGTAAALAALALISFVVMINYDLTTIQRPSDFENINRTAKLIELKEVGKQTYSVKSGARQGISGGKPGHEWGFEASREDIRALRSRIQAAGFTGNALEGEVGGSWIGISVTPRPAGYKPRTPGSEAFGKPGVVVGIIEFAAPEGE